MGRPTPLRRRTTRPSPPSRNGGLRCSTPGAEQVEETIPGELVGYEVYNEADDSWAPLGGPDAATRFDGDAFVAELGGTTFRLSPNEGGSWTYVQSQGGSEVSTSMPASRVRELYSDGEATTKLVCRGEFDAQKGRRGLPTPCPNTRRRPWWALPTSPRRRPARSK